MEDKSMRAISVVILQIVMSFVVAAAAMPAILFGLPSARGRLIGPALTLGVTTAVFVLLRLAWRRQPTR
jgi:hypothetical protein